MENIYQNIDRFKQDVSIGLTDNLVKSRIEQGLSNIDTSIPTRTIIDIIKDNLFTLFNLINVSLALAILYAGSYKNLMFIGVVICNCAIGIIQEIRSKITIDKLKLISEDHVQTIRNGKTIRIHINDIVLDDIIKYSPGDQIAADCSIIDGFCEVNEALLTGESDLIRKNKGDIILSGSFIVSGSCYARVEHIGKDNYASKILRGAKYVKNSKSEIMSFLKKLIKVISISIIPIGMLLFYRQIKITNYDINSAIVTTSAALIGMIPEGLVLLTSTALAIGVIKLSKYKILVQDIYCTETLARIDTLCLDKTGTITDGNLDVVGILPQNRFSEKEVCELLDMLMNTLNDSNKTFTALQTKFKISKASYKADNIFPFSSDKKWSGAFFKDKGCYIIGAAECIFKQNFNKIKDIISEYSKTQRVLVLAHSNEAPINGDIPDNIELISLIFLKDRLRKDARKTLKYFSDQGVDVKIISGDNVMTVSNIAKNVGLKSPNSYIDMTTLKTDEEIQQASIKYNIFGRTTPLQKQKLIKAFKSQGRTVAMTGDGVNDVLALKEADCSIAMANGSDAARAVSHIVLLDSNFSFIPTIVSEGRRVINNIQRSSSLFLVKTIYSCVLAVLFLFIPVPYPFIPIQMTLISVLTIGIPSFILTLEPNYKKIKKGFVNTILKTSLPISIFIVINILIFAIAHIIFHISINFYSTICVILTGFLEISLLYKISLPLNNLRKSLILIISIIFTLCILFFKSVFSLHTLNLMEFILVIATILLNSIIINKFYLNNIGLTKSINN